MSTAQIHKRPGGSSKAIQNLRGLFSSSEVAAFDQALMAVSAFEGSSALYKKVAQAIGVDEAKDHLAEFWYAAVFHTLEWAVKFEPFGRKGPDLRITKGSLRYFVEVTRLRPVHAGPKEFTLNTPSATIEPYGDLTRDIQRAYSKISGKSHQCKDGPTILAIWNDDHALEEVEVLTAVRNMAELSQCPPDLQLVIYGSKWLSLRRQQFSCFYPPNQLAKDLGLFTSQLERCNLSSCLRSLVGTDPTIASEASPEGK